MYDMICMIWYIHTTQSIKASSCSYFFFFFFFCSGTSSLRALDPKVNSVMYSAAAWPVPLWPRAPCPARPLRDPWRRWRRSSLARFNASTPRAYSAASFLRYALCAYIIIKYDISYIHKAKAYGWNGGQGMGWQNQNKTKTTRPHISHIHIIWYDMICISMSCYLDDFPALQGQPRFGVFLIVVCIWPQQLAHVPLGLHMDAHTDKAAISIMGIIINMGRGKRESKKRGNNINDQLSFMYIYPFTSTHLCIN